MLIFFCGRMVWNISSWTLLYDQVSFLNLLCNTAVDRVDFAIEINRFTLTINKMNDSINSDQFILRLCIVFRDSIILIAVFICFVLKFVSDSKFPRIS